VELIVLKFLEDYSSIFEMISQVLSTVADHVNLSLPRLPDSFIELVRIDDPKVPAPVTNFLDLPQPFAASGVQFAEITSAQELCRHETDVKQVYELELRVPERLDYLPGNTIGILPENRAADVQFVVSRVLEDCDGATYQMRVAADTKKKAAKLPAFVPTVLAVDKVLMHCLDLQAIPKKVRKTLQSTGAF
jgi:sulfite reductase alpha subunit-like flavoprotein